jgi:hypothetical protein
MVNIPWGAARLKELSPECTKHNPYFKELVLGSFILIFVMEKPLTFLGRLYFNASLPPSKYPPNSKMRKERVDINAEHLFKGFFYFITSVILFLLLKRTNYLHPMLTGSNLNPRLFENYPC